MTTKHTASRAGTVRRFAGNPLTWLLLLPVIVVPTVLLVMQARAGSAAELPIRGAVPVFELQDQHARSLKSEELRGTVWIANFIFTRCEVVCPLTTAKMAEVQRRLGTAGVRFVSFSVDPQYDTPERLRTYANRFKADHSTWSFVRGPRRTMKQIVNDGFKIGMGIIGVEDDADTDTTNVAPADMVHGEHFVLVDKQLRIRGYYTLEDDASLSKLVHHAKMLVKQ